MNLAHWVRRAGREFAGRPALAIGETAVLDYAGLADRVARLAGGLESLDVGDVRVVSPLLPPAADEPDVAPYRILQRIGSGGMGEVWKARDTRLNRLVAIKASLSPFSERFEREARAIAFHHRDAVWSVDELFQIGVVAAPGMLDSEDRARRIAGLVFAVVVAILLLGNLEVVTLTAESTRDPALRALVDCRHDLCLLADDLDGARVHVVVRSELSGGEITPTGVSNDDPRVADAAAAQPCLDVDVERFRRLPVLRRACCEHLLVHEPLPRGRFVPECVERVACVHRRRQCCCRTPSSAKSAYRERAEAVGESPPEHPPPPVDGVTLRTRAGSMRNASRPRWYRSFRPTLSSWA